MNEQTVWELINPEGAIQLEPSKVNPRPKTLQGKTVLLRWNGKHNGDIFLKRIAELLEQNVTGVKIIKNWEIAHETATHSQNPNTSKQFARKLARHNPDVVISAQAD